MGETTLTLWLRTVQRIRSWCQTTELSPEKNSFRLGVSCLILLVSAPPVPAPLLSHDGWLFCGASGHPWATGVPGWPSGCRGGVPASPLSCLSCIPAFCARSFGLLVFLRPLHGPLVVTVFFLSIMSCGRASTLDQPVRTPCRQ